MSLLDERYEPQSAISKRRREELQEATDANSIGRQPVTWDNLLQTREELAEVKRWQATAMGNNGITINGNVFSGPNIPAPAAQEFTLFVLVVNPTDALTAFVVTETLHAVAWPDGTACAVDIGFHDSHISFVGYTVLSGTLYLRWLSTIGDSSTIYLPGANVTVTAFLAN